MTEGNSYPHTTNVHKVLAHSYLIYFVLFLLGVTLDFFFRFKIFSSSVMTPVGLIFLLLATFLILWAQHTSRNLNKVNITKESFLKGPYSYMRSPTHWGLFFLMLGFGIIANAIFVVLSTCVSFLITRFVFLDREEMLLEKKYGTPYLEYKQIVKL